MRAGFTHLDFLLDNHQSFTFSRAGQAALHVQQGRVWVTQDGNREDYVVEAGQTLRIKGEEPVVVSALAETRLSLDQRQCRKALERVGRALKAAYLRLIHGWAVPQRRLAPRAQLPAW